MMTRCLKCGCRWHIGKPGFVCRDCKYDALLEALKMLYIETGDYIKINQLGKVHHNRSMQLAREALELAGHLDPIISKLP